MKPEPLIELEIERYPCEVTSVFRLLMQSIEIQHMKNVTFAAILLLEFSVTASARLGENADAIVQRYGSPISHGGEYNYWFSFHGYKVAVVFSKSFTSVIETFAREDGNEMEEKEIEAILTPNTLRSRWQKLPNYNFKVWRLESNVADAWYRGRELTLTTEWKIEAKLDYEKKSQEADRIRAEKRNAEDAARRLKGF